jgi:uncharacterized protein
VLDRAVPPPQESAMIAPPRLIALDVLRGVAVMGILLMNIASFGLPQAAYLNPAAYGGATGADLAAWTFGFVLIDGKMRALFSLLFGAGMVLVIERAEAAGQNGMIVHLRRMVTLLAIGVVHAYLIWAGDILILYAIVGTFALAQVGRSNRGLLAIASLLLVVQWLLLWSLVGGLGTIRDAGLAPGASVAAVQAWRSIADQLGIPSLMAIGRELATFQGDYAGIFSERLRHASAPLLQLVDAGAETLALMLLGMAAIRSGFLSGRWSASAYARTAAITYATGLPLLALLAANTIRSGFDEVVTVQAATLYAAPLRVVVMIGHVALLLYWVKRAPDSWLAGRVAAVGRTALSNYLSTSIVMTAIFYGYGLGWFGQLSRAQLYGMVPVAWVAMLAWSKPWLDRYRHGPFEWLWRSMARGRMQQMQKAQNQY